jgi:hypothetical protein
MESPIRAASLNAGMTIEIVGFVEPGPLSAEVSDAVIERRIVSFQFCAKRLG